MQADGRLLWRVFDNLLSNICINNFFTCFILQLLHTCRTQTIINACIHIAGTALIKFFLGNLSITKITNNLILVHGILTAKDTLQLMSKYPPSWFPDIFVHCRRNRSNHPAISVTMAYFFSNSFCFWTVPKFVPALCIQITHYFLILSSVTRHNITVWINKEGVKTHITRKESLLSIDVVNQAMVEVSTEPLLRVVGLEKLIDKILKILCNHRTIMDDVLCLYEIETVMERCCSKLHAHLIGKLIERNKVRSVFVLNSHTEANILHPLFS